MYSTNQPTSRAEPREWREWTCVWPRRAPGADWHGTLGAWVRCGSRPRHYRPHTGSSGHTAGTALHKNRRCRWTGRPGTVSEPRTIPRPHWPNRCSSPPVLCVGDAIEITYEKFLSANRVMDVTHRTTINSEVNMENRGEKCSKIALLRWKEKQTITMQYKIRKLTGKSRDYID